MSESKGKRVELLLVKSTTIPGSLGMRTPDGGLFGHIRTELVRAGFKPGDRVMIIAADEHEELLSAAGKPR